MRRRAGRLCVVFFVTLACALLAAPVGGQTATPETATTQGPTTAPTEAPTLTPDPATPVPTTTPGTPPPTATPSPSPSPSPTPALQVPVLSRTPPHDTTLLVESLLPMTEWGLSLDEVLVEGMGRFPVAGYARYSDDWLAPRYVPTPHLHRGLDIFAALGTPVRAPDAGVVTKISDSYPGGKSVTMSVYDGTTYYFGHLASRAWGLEVGQNVEVGTVLGYVGNTGNAQGGAPHVHLEAEQEGVRVPPKPIVDAWLSDAEASAGDWMERKRLEIDVARRLPVCSDQPSTSPNVTLFQILGDPIELDFTAATCELEPVGEVDPSLVDLLIVVPA